MIRRRATFLLVGYACLVLASSCSAVTEPPQPESLDGAVTHVFKSTPQAELRLHAFNPPGSSEDASASFADARSAIHWVRSHASELGIDPDRIAAGGGSSGGSIAWGTAILDGDEAAEIDGVSFRPNALVQFNPGTLGRDLRSGLPPAVVYQGTEDTITPHGPAREFCAAYERGGNQCRFVSFEGAQHRFFNPDVEEGRWYRETLLDLDRFLTGLGFLPMPPADEVEWPLP